MGRGKEGQIARAIARGRLRDRGTGREGRQKGTETFSKRDGELQRQRGNQRHRAAFRFRRRQRQKRGRDRRTQRDRKPGKQRQGALTRE